MKRNLLVTTLFFMAIFFAVVNYSYAQNTISGHVYYQDDHSLVTSGTVSAYDLLGNFVATTNINPDGSYAIYGVGGTQYDIIGIPNIGPEDDHFIPTGYPSAIAPSEMLAVQGGGTVINIDVYVKRLTQGPSNRFSVSISGSVMNDNKPVKEAVVYAMSGNDIYGFGITNSDGSYKINNIPQGDYILVVHRIGDESVSKNIELTSDMISVNFSIVPVKSGKNLNSNPVEFKLSQNFPNPFNPSTVINYVVPKDGNVSLKVYNSLGEMVASLVSADQTAGAYSVKFDGTNLSSGIYFYTIQTGAFVDTKRMVLVK